MKAVTTLCLLLGGGLGLAEPPQAAAESWSLADCAQVLRVSKDRKQREQALFRTIQLLIEKEDYQAAADSCLLYLDKDKGFAQLPRASLVCLSLGTSYEKRGMTGDALGAYCRVWSAHPGRIAASAPAMEAYMRLLWERNQPAQQGQSGDREGAVEAGVSYLQMTTPIKDQMLPHDLKLWLALEKRVKHYQQQLQPAARAGGPEQVSPPER